MARVSFFILITIFYVLTSTSLAMNGDLGAANGADGSEASPWLIEDFADFQAFCNDESKWDKEDYTQLEADIDLDPSLPGRSEYARGLIHSLNSHIYYHGSFNGNNKSINNVTIVGGSENCGLFGQTSFYSKIFNLYLNNINMSDVGSYSGGLVGNNQGMIKNCHLTGSISGQNYVGGIVGYNSISSFDNSIYNCSFTGTLSGGNYIGGICGRQQGRSAKIINCNASGKVHGGSYVGGLVGLFGGNGSSLSDSSFSGNIEGVTSVGGIVGQSYDQIKNCFSEGEVIGQTNVGGLIGYASCTEDLGATSHSIGEIYQCYSNCDVIGNDHVGGLAGVNYSRIDTPLIFFSCYTTGNIKGENFIGGLVGQNGQAGSVINCYTAGSVFGNGLGAGILVGENYGNIERCYASGSCDGEMIIGAVHVSPVACFWDTETSGITDPEEGMEDTDRLIGLSTAEMQTQANFIDAGWDFVDEDTNGSDDIWRMPYASPGYPILSWQKDIPGDLTGSYGVDIEDFSILANTWQYEYSIADLATLATYWLEGK